MDPESYTDFLFPTLLQLQHIYEQLSNSRPNGLEFCILLASVILADVNMRFSHYLSFSDSTQTQSAALASMTHPAFKLRRIKPTTLDQTINLFFNTLDFYLLGRTSKMLCKVWMFRWYTLKNFGFLYNYG